MARDHLSLQEIEWLAERPRETIVAQGLEADMREARRHLDGCELCQGLVQTHGDLGRWVGEIGEARSGPSCPSEDEWWRIAACLLPEPRTAELLEHAIQCDACGLLLRQAVQDLAEEATEEGITELGALPSVQQEQQRSLAQILSAAQSDRGKSADDGTHVGGWFRGLAKRFAWQARGRFQYSWAYAAAAVAFLVVGAWILEKQRQPSIDQLIASAYTAQRPFEPRISDAEYGPVRQQRGGERSGFAEPAALLRAKYLIKERLTANPDDQAMLAASGRVELLEGHYDEAIRNFRRAEDAHSDSSALLIDLATAYFQRAEAEDRTIDYGQAIELLGQALAKTPDNTVALFNRALALEKMYAYKEAIRDWEHCLRVDSGSTWKGEAQRHLSELREKMKAREKPSVMLRSDPGTATLMLRARATDQSSLPAGWPASLDEEYLDIVVREWLPSLYVFVDSPPLKSWKRDPAVWSALTVVAEGLLARHNDRWLADFLGELPPAAASPSFVERFVTGLDFLARATKANDSGDPDSASALAESAARSYRSVGSKAGYLRAREELIYSQARAVRVQECLQAAGQQLGEAKLDSYSWLKGQAILLLATCQSYAGNLALAQTLSERALKLTEKTGYAGQHLRSVLFAGGFLRSTERDWHDTRAGLQEFWTELNNPLHAYESYVELAILAEEAEKWHLAYPFNREALAMVELTADRLYKARAHYRLAMAAMMIENLPEAETEFRIASEQFAALPNSPTRTASLIVSGIELAGIEIQQGRLESAGRRLEQARPLLANTADSAIPFRFYQTLGQLQFRRGNLAGAEQALLNALRIGEVRLRSLKTETDRLAWERDTAPAYHTLVELFLRNASTNIRALEVWEWYRASTVRASVSPAFGSDRDPANSAAGPRPAVIAQVRETVPTLKHETVISFAYLPSGVAAWAFDDRGVKFAWIAASSEELARRVRHFARMCADASSDVTKLRQEGRNLYDLLIGPFDEHLDPSRLMIVEPDSVLSDVPWPALVDSRGEYLASRYATVISPGLGYWLKLRPAATISEDETALVVGMPTLASVVASRFAPLPDANREAQSIAARFRHSRVLSGKEVTSLAIRQGLPRSDVFHFAGHAVSGLKHGGLVLASSPSTDVDADEASLLSANDLERALLQRLQLVVLSACPTAETENVLAEPGTLVRGFLGAGIPHVVASRWPVDSPTTEQIMAGYYTRLFQGQTSARALQEATATLRLEAATSHPYYWAAFGSYGR